MVDVYQIRLHLNAWINGKISLSEFEDWFVPETWDVHKSGDKKAEDLVDEIELNLSEYSGGYLSKEQLLEAMKSLLPKPFPIVVIEWPRAGAIQVPLSSLQRKSSARSLVPLAATV